MITKVLKGHNSRGEEVIELLKMLGGKNTVGFKTTFTGFYYWINENNEIVATDMPPQNSMVYPLEDFEDEYPYKVGDCVRYYPHKVSVIKSMFLSYDGDVKYELEGVDDRFFQAHQLKYVGRTEYYEIRENNCQVIGNDTSNEGIDLQKLEKQLDEVLENETKESLEEFFFNAPEPEPKAPILSNRYDYAAGKCGYVIPDGYEFDCIKDGSLFKEIILKPIVEHKSHQTDIDAEQENTKTSFTFDCIRNEKGENQLIIPSHLEVIIEDGIYILREKKPLYPKTYSECCKIVNASIFVSLVYNLTDGEGYSHDVDNLKIYDNIRRLKICRDAYWKIAGEELGLDKPWEPDWNNDEEYKYGLFRLRDDIYKDASCINPTLLIFPTKEMRDAFYENFKDLIEGCKEFL